MKEGEMERCETCNCQGKSRKASWVAVTCLGSTGYKDRYFCHEHKGDAPTGAAVLSLEDAEYSMIYVGRDRMSNWA